MLHGINPDRYPLRYRDTEFPERVVASPTLPKGSLRRALRGEEISELKLDLPKPTHHVDVPGENIPPAQPIAQQKIHPKARKKDPPTPSPLTASVLAANHLCTSFFLPSSWDLLRTRERLRRSFSTPLAAVSKHKTPILDSKRELEKYHAQWAAEHEPRRPPPPPQPGADGEAGVGSMWYYGPGTGTGSTIQIHADPNPGLRDWRAEPIMAEEPRDEPEVWYSAIDTHPPARPEPLTLETITVPPEGYLIDCYPRQDDSYPAHSRSSRPPWYTRRASLERLNRGGGADSPPAFTPAFAPRSPAPSGIDSHDQPPTGAGSSDDNDAWPLTAEADCALRWAERTRRVSREVEGRWRR